MAEDNPHPFENWLIALYGIWVFGTYLGSPICFTLYSTTGSGSLFCAAAVVMVPAAFYIERRLSADKKKNWFQHLLQGLLAGVLLTFMSYWALQKTDLLLAAITRPTHQEEIVIKSLKKEYVIRQGWDHTSINVIYLGHDLQLEGSRTAYFLLQNKKMLLVTIGQSYTGNYFVTDVHVPTAERWAARRNYLMYVVSQWWWIIALTILVLLMIWLKRKLWPNLSLAAMGWKKLMLFALLAVAITLALIYLVLSIIVSR